MKGERKRERVLRAGDLVTLTGGAHLWGGDLRDDDEISAVYLGAKKSKFSAFGRTVDVWDHHVLLSTGKLIKLVRHVEVLTPDKSIVLRKAIGGCVG